jgi:hypothetical protein
MSSSEFWQIALMMMRRFLRWFFQNRETGGVTNYSEQAIRTLIKWAGDDPEREGLRDTPSKPPSGPGWLHEINVVAGAIIPHSSGPTFPNAGLKLRQQIDFALDSAEGEG